MNPIEILDFFLGGGLRNQKGKELVILYSWLGRFV